MQELFYPNSIAIIGASRHKMKIGSVILRNILSSNYKGELFLVNPSSRSIEGIPVHSDITHLPQGIQLAIVIIPAAFVLDAVTELGKKGVKYVIIISAGFKESGKDGVVRERALAKIASLYGIQIVGPNCLGVINNDAHIHAYNGSFGLLSKKSGSVSLISQSGALISSCIDKADILGMGFNKIISLGNKLGINEVDCIRYLEKDAKTQVIGLYLEGIAQPKEFIQAIHVSKKPIIILKAGKSQKARKTIQSHTGSLAGDAIITDTLLKEAGAIVVYSLDELFDTMRLFSTFKAVSRHGLAVVTNAGGMGVLSVDAIVQKNIKLASIEPKALIQLQKILPAAANFHNPIDVLGDADDMRYRETLNILMKEKSVGAIMIVITPQVMTPLAAIGRVIKDTVKQYPHKPVVVVPVGGSKMNILYDQLGSIPYFDSPERAIYAISTLYQWNHQPRNAKLWDAPTTYVKKSSVQQIQDALARDKDKKIATASWETVNLIARELSLELPKTLRLETKSDIKKLETYLTYPVVVKNVDPNILHRTDAGLVKVNIHTLQEVESFYRKHMKGTVIVQEQAQKGIEVFVGVKRDSELGAVLVVGFGGIYAEIIHDMAFASMPITKPYILKTLKKTKTYHILAGARGIKYDINWLIDTIFQLNLLVYSVPMIEELDVNPIIVYEQGGCVLDLKVKI